MTSHQSMTTPEKLHTIKHRGMDIHDVLSKTKNIEVLKKILHQGERPCSSGQCFILAARSGKLDLVKTLLEVEPAGINTQDQNGKSLLSYFAMQPKDLLQLLKMGANPAVSDIGSVLECLTMNTKKEESEVIEILNIVTSAGVKIDDINDAHKFNKLVDKPRILKHLLDLGVSINPNMPGIHDVMKTITTKYNDSWRLSIMTQVLTKLSESGVSLVDDEGITLLKYCSGNFRSIKLLITLGTPLQEPYVQRSLKTLVSRFHTKAESSDVYDILNLIVSNGHKLVDGEGNSVIKYCSNNKKMMLYLLHAGADPNVPRILDHVEECARQCTEHELKEILGLIAGAGVTLKDCFSSLKYNIKSTVMIRYLLKLGASPFIHGENFIYETLRNSSSENYVKELESFIECGFNILDEDKHGCTFLCSAIKICVENTGKDTSIYDASCHLVRYVLNHRAIRDKNFKVNCKSGYHPQELVLASRRLGLLCHSRLADMVFNSKLIDTHRVIKRHAFGSEYMSVLSWYLKKFSYCNTGNDAYQEIEYLCKVGFSVNDPGVSPLTVLMMNFFDNEMAALQSLLQRGVNVEQRLVVLEDTKLQDLKDSLKIPDALVMAAMKSRSLAVIKLLAPHSAFPPLAMLLFTTYYYHYTNDRIKWFRALQNLGRVPHGTQTYRAIRERVTDMAKSQHNQDLMLPAELDIPDQVGGIQSQDLTMFDVAHRSPLSLLELSRYAVKMCLADTAAASNTQSLPQLFKSLLPPGLTDQHIAHKIEQVRNSENKWLSNEEELLKNPPSLRFVECVSNMAGSPVSLLELSRYAVRMCLSDTAAASNTQSLPQLFKSLLPPGLTDQHIAHKIEQVRNSEVKWLSNEDELLKNPPSLRFGECVSDMAGGNKRRRLI